MTEQLKNLRRLLDTHFASDCDQKIIREAREQTIMAIVDQMIRQNVATEAMENIERIRREARKEKLEELELEYREEMQRDRYERECESQDIRDQDGHHSPFR